MIFNFSLWASGSEASVRLADSGSQWVLALRDSNIIMKVIPIYLTSLSRHGDCAIGSTGQPYGVMYSRDLCPDTVTIAENAYVEP